MPCLTLTGHAVSLVETKRLHHWIGLEHQQPYVACNLPIDIKHRLPPAESSSSCYASGRSGSGLDFLVLSPAQQSLVPSFHALFPQLLIEPQLHSINMGRPYFPKWSVGACRTTRSGFERLVFRLRASGCIDDRTNIACFAVFFRRKNARSRADDGVLRQTP